MSERDFDDDCDGEDVTQVRRRACPGCGSREHWTALGAPDAPLAIECANTVASALLARLRERPK